jgi:hypothetical protein
MKWQFFMRLLACTQLGVALGAVLAASLEKEPAPVPEGRPCEFIHFEEVPADSFEEVPADSFEEVPADSFEEVPADSLEDIMLGGLK